MKITLSKPIQVPSENLANGPTKEVSEITLRAPHGGDIRRCGLPYRLGEKADGTSYTDFDADAVSKYVCALAGLPQFSVDQLCPADWQKCMNAVISFFGDSTAGTSSTGTSS